MKTIQQTRKRRAWLWAALWDAAWLCVVACLVSLLVRTARADCVVAFWSPACGPCLAQKPIEEKLQSEGHDIRLVNVQEQPQLARAYRVSRIPCVVYVAETPTGNYECGRLTGLQTEATLRQFCQPRVLLYNTQPVLNTVRWVLGFPLIFSY